MKQNIKLLCVCAALSLLAGCSAESVISDDNAREYSKLLAEGKLDENGYYINDTYDAEYDETAPETETAEEALSQETKSIHGTLAKNKYISVTYYLTDSSTGEKAQIEGDEFYADPGDVLHAEWKTENPVSSMYDLDTFNAYKFVDGTRSSISLDTVYNRDGSTADITLSSEGDYSIEPVGKYIDRVLSMNASYAGQNTDYGTWRAYVRVSATEFSECDPAKMDPTKDYKVTYSYPYADYYIESCTPDDSNVHTSDAQGELTFGPYAATDDVSRFDIVLRNYLMCRVQGDINAVNKITVDGEDKTSQLKSSRKSDSFAFIENVKYHYLEGMKVKSKVIVDLNSGYEMDYTELTTPMDKQSLGDGSTRYSFEFTDSDTNIALLFIHKAGKDSAIEYIEPVRDEADVSVKFSDDDNHHVPKTGEMINPSQNVTVTIMPKPGYYFTDENMGTFNVEFRNYSKELANRISNYIQKYVVMELDAADNDGKLSFQLDGVSAENTVSAKQGQKLTFTYTVNDSEHYQIECRNNAFWDKYKETFTYTFDVTPDLSGKVISLAFLEDKFNFGVVAK